MKNINVNLTELAEGTLQEQFEQAMEEVTKNILDVNTDPTKKRQITIVLDILSDEFREEQRIAVTVKPPKLVGRDSSMARVLIGREQNKVVANELKSSQKGQMYFDPDDSQLKEDDGTPVKEEIMSEAENKQKNLLKIVEQ